MLSNPELFTVVENLCREQGVIERFEAENGKIAARMMIDVVKTPTDVILPVDSDNCVAFEASFDFVDICIGLVLDVVKREAISGIWQYSKSSEQISAKKLVDFFIDKLMESINPDGSYSYPIYVFSSEKNSFSAIPTAPDEEYENME